MRINRFKWYAIPIMIICMSMAAGCAKSTLDMLKDKTKKNPTSVQAHSNLAFELANQGKFEEALNEYKKALELRPTDFLAKNNMGQVLYQMGRYDESLKVFLELVKVHSTRSDVNSNIAMNYHNMKQYDKALQYYQKALELSPKNEKAREGLNFLMQDIKAAGLKDKQAAPGAAQPPAPAQPEKKGK